MFVVKTLNVESKVKYIHNLWNIGLYPPLMCGVYNVSDVSLIRVIQSGHIVSAGPGHVTRPGNRSWRTMVLWRSGAMTRGHEVI